MEILTANELIQTIPVLTFDDPDIKFVRVDDVEKKMLEFAKCHLQQAIIEITMKAKMNVYPYDQEEWEYVPTIIQVAELDMIDGEIEIDLDSIVKAYPIENIK